MRGRLTRLWRSSPISTGRGRCNTELNCRKNQPVFVFTREMMIAELQKRVIRESSYWVEGNAIFGCMKCPVSCPANREAMLRVEVVEVISRYLNALLQGM